MVMDRKGGLIYRKIEPFDTFYEIPFNLGHVFRITLAQNEEGKIEQFAGFLVWYDKEYCYISHNAEHYGKEYADMLVSQRCKLGIEKICKDSIRVITPLEWNVDFMPRAHYSELLRTQKEEQKKESQEKTGDKVLMVI